MDKLNKLPLVFQATAGAILLATACALFLVNLTGPPDLVTPHDPILGLSIHSFDWILGSLTLAVALDCLFGNSPFRSQLCVAWLATNVLVYQISLPWMGAHGFSGYLEGVNYTFRTNANVAAFITQAIWLYLLAGSYTSIWCLVKSRSAKKSAPPIQTILQEAQTASIASRTLKIACTACGGHIEFPTNRFGETIHCPHCQNQVTLQKPKTIKMGCPNCHQNIEFPDFAGGQKVSCPHCKLNITLTKLE